MSEFKNRKDALDGKRNDCKACARARESVRRKRPDVKAKILAAQSVRRKRNYSFEDNKDRVLRERYGISLAEYQVMFESQNGLCAICGSIQSDKYLAVDHNHDTGHIRRLLCAACNQGLGLFRDSADLLVAAATYLIQSEQEWRMATADTAALQSQQQ